MNKSTKRGSANSYLTHTKMEKGITLIALIITIVVLLILAVVSIGAVKNSKIITHSQDASNEHIIGQEKEKIQLALGEWQIQKNIPGNENKFKEIISEALGDDNAEVLENDDGTLTITFDKTGNKYQITKDGEIEETYKLEKYVFGEDLQGRDLKEIMDINEEYFYNEDMEYLTTRNEGYDNDGLYTVYYIKYNNNTYRFKAIYGEEKIHKTDPSYGIIGINVTGEKVGKKVSYDGKIWTILYDDETNGLQMISDKVCEYSGDYFRLGRNDSSITDWDSLKRVADLDENGTLSDIEKSIYSYNNAITTLNTACQSIVPSNDNIIDVRCVGSNPTNKNSENTTVFTSENLAKWPVGSTKYKSGIADKKCKSEDLNYEADFDRMVALGINIGYDDSNKGKNYWLASRFVTDIGVFFNMRYVDNPGWSTFYILCYITENNAIASGDGKYLRPVVKLDRSVVFSGDGTSDSPYTF